MNLIKALKEAQIILQKNNIKNNTLDAEVLLSYIIQKPKEFLYTYPETKLSKNEIEKYNKLIKKRLDNTPLAYIIGEKDFYSLKFKINKNVLTPRPETEIIIDEVLKIKELKENTKRFKNKKINIIDIGTGSGCIITTLSKLIKNKKVLFFGLDISKKALKVAKKNAKLNQAHQEINFIHSNLFEYFAKNPSKIVKTNIITANLPYLTKKEFENSISIQKEPQKALIAPENGLYFYRRLFEMIAKNYDSNQKYYIFCEINPWQKKELILLIKKYFPLAGSEVIKDICKMDRLVKIKL